jgi:hypothetical protein
MLHATSLRPRPNTYRENLDLREHSYTTYMDARTMFLHFGKPLRTERLENRSPDASSTTFTSLSHDISLPKDQKFLCGTSWKTMSTANQELHFGKRIPYLDPTTKLGLKGINTSYEGLDAGLFQDFPSRVLSWSKLYKDEDYYLIYIGDDLKVMDWMTMEGFMVCFT